MDKQISSYINDCLKNVDFVEGIDYGQVLKARKKFINRKTGNNFSGGWFGSMN
jgi:hypothetical protein